MMGTSQRADARRVPEPAFRSARENALKLPRFTQEIRPRAQALRRRADTMWRRQWA
jgi:hypothetical protein